MGKAPSQEEVLSYFDKLSNWGRWGKEDTLGALNLITPKKRVQAAALVKDGESVSCSRLIPRTPPLSPSVVHFHMAQSGERYALGDDGPEWTPGVKPLQWAAEYLAFSFHGLTFTHIDGLAHVFWKGQMYNGRSAALVKASEGALVQNTDVMRDGIMTKAVLLDVARLKGKPWLTGQEHVFPEDLEAAEQAQKCRVEEGDIVLLRTGFPAEIADVQSKDPLAPPPHEHSGYNIACAPWFRERGVAVIGSDVINDAAPVGDYKETMLPIHQVALVAMGLRLIDNGDFERLAEVCARKNRWEFMLTLNPLRIQNGTGSPANPIATF